MPKKEDQAVDGPSIAARILNRMSDSVKQRVMQELQSTSPEIAQRLQQNLLRFEDLSELTPKGAQALIKEVDERDLLLSLKTATLQVKETLLKNMSSKRREITEENLQRLPAVPMSEVDEARRRILFKLEELRKAGRAQTNSKNDFWV